MRTMLLITAEKARSIFQHWDFPLMDSIPHNSCSISIILDSIIDILTMVWAFFLSVQNIRLNADCLFNYILVKLDLAVEDA